MKDPVEKIKSVKSNIEKLFLVTTVITIIIQRRNNYYTPPDEEIHAISVASIIVKRLGIYKSMFFSDYHDRYIIQIKWIARSWSPVIKCLWQPTNVPCSWTLCDNLKGGLCELRRQTLRPMGPVYCNGFVHSQYDHCTLPSAMHNKPVDKHNSAGNNRHD